MKDKKDNPRFKEITRKLMFNESSFYFGFSL